MKVDGQRHAASALPPAKWPGSRCIGGWVETTSGLDGCGKSRPHRYSVSGPSSRYIDCAIPQSSPIPRQTVRHLTVQLRARLNTLVQTIIRTCLHLPTRSIDLSRTAFMCAFGYPHMKKIPCLVPRKRNSCIRLSTSCLSFCIPHVLRPSNIIPIVRQRSVCLTARTTSSRIPGTAVPSMLQNHSAVGVSVDGHPRQGPRRYQPECWSCMGIGTHDEDSMRITPCPSLTLIDGGHTLTHRTHFVCPQNFVDRVKRSVLKSYPFAKLIPWIATARKPICA
jgi:hypothetical protein